MASSGEPFMAPSVCGPRSSLSGNEGAWRSIPLGVFLQTFFQRSVVKLPPQASSKSIMAG